MNLWQDHVRMFRRRLQCAMVLYPAVGVACLTGSIWMAHLLDQKIEQLQITRQQIKTGLGDQEVITINKKDIHTMEDVKNHLTHLFSTPLLGISFNGLSLDEEGLRVRGNARTSDALEAWLAHLSEVFMIDTRATQQHTEKGVTFEVLLHEKY